MADLPDVYREQTLRQFISSYNHITTSHLGSRLTAQVDHTTATRGAITTPERRLAPKRIEPWSVSDREEEDHIISTILREVDGIGGDIIAFPARYFVDRVGEDLSRLDAENALLLYDSDTLHKPAARILHTLLANERIRTALARRRRRQQQQQQPDEAQQQAAHAESSLFAYRPGKLSFTTHLNQLRQSQSAAGKKRKRDAIPTVPVLGPADVFCIFQPETLPPSDTIVVDPGPSTGASSTRPELLFLKEAKARHKLTDDIIDRAVGVAGNKSLDPRVMMGRGVGDGDENPDSLDTEDCEYWFAAVCAQIYTSMIDKGLRYGIISTGSRYIFVSIDPANLEALSYSICRPSSDIVTSTLMRTVSLALLAMQLRSLPGSRDLDSLRNGEGLVWNTATASFTTVNSLDPQARAGTTETESWNDSPPQVEEDGGCSSMSDHAGDHGDASRILHDAMLRHDIDQHVGQGSTSTDTGPQDNQTAFSRPSTPPRSHLGAEEQEGAFCYPSPPPHGDPVPGKRGNKRMSLDNVEGDVSVQHAKRAKIDIDVGLITSPPRLPTSPAASTLPVQHTGYHDRQFCTQECLQSLICSPNEERPPADTACPNYAHHQRIASLTDDQFRQQLQAQLTTSAHNAPPQFSDGYEFLHSTTGHTQIVKLHLSSSGHVLLAKAFKPSDIGVMRREARCYAHLRHLQGRYIPICLGTIELSSVKALKYDGFRFTGLLLLGWAGAGPDQWKYVGGGLGYGEEADRAFTRALTVEVSKALSEIHKAGVLHRDVALRNVLVRHFSRAGTPTNPEWRLQVSIIDFERSRNRAMYRHYKSKRDRSRSHTKEDMNKAFAGALAREMDKCVDAMGKWCPT